jgi:glycerol-3-phosphate acyltransferase PlsY
MLSDELQPSTPSPDSITFRLLIGLVSFLVAGAAAYYATKALSQAPGKTISRFTVAGETYAIQSRLPTGLQRADHVAFFDDGDRLAMSCPRYSKITLWNTEIAPVKIKEVDLQGRPVGLTALGDRIVVLQRPPGDDRHIKPGFFEVFDRDGARVAGPVDVGWDPDQIRIVERDGKSYALILLSGSAEGESNRPAPSLIVASFDRAAAKFEQLSQVNFEADGEDPLHFFLVVETREGKTDSARALVCFGRKPGAVWVDWTDPAAARISKRLAWPESAGEPARYVDDRQAGRILAISTDGARAAAFPIDGESPEVAQIASPSNQGKSDSSATEMRFFAIDQEKGLLGRYGTNQGILVRLPLRGPYGFGSVRLTDIAVFEGPDGKPKKIAACDRSGGLHWIDAE